MDDPAFGLMTGGLISVGLLTADQQTAIKALGENRQSRAEVLFGTGVHNGDVSFALRGQR